MSSKETESVQSPSVDINWRDVSRFYFLDFLSLVALIICAGLVSLISPYDRFFVEQDPTLSYPFVESSVPLYLLIILSLLVPLLVIFFTQIVLHKFRKEEYVLPPMLTYRFLPYFTLVHSYILCLVVTTLLKDFVGRKRPNFFAYCNYQGYRDALTSGNFTSYFNLTSPGRVGSIEYCLDKSSLNDAQSSFPSGHSSQSFAGLMIALWFVLYCIPFLVDRKSVWHFRMWRISVFGVFFGLAATIAGTRTRDYWHNFDDILSGSVIGTLCAIFAVYVNTTITKSRSPEYKLVPDQV
jgi:diacylglycerol diphosphate phosphatase/phosphatidate phosphatase